MRKATWNSGVCCFQPSEGPFLDLLLWRWKGHMLLPSPSPPLLTLDAAPLLVLQELLSRKVNSTFQVRLSSSTLHFSEGKGWRCARKTMPGGVGESTLLAKARQMEDGCLWVNIDLFPYVSSPPFHSYKPHSRPLTVISKQRGIEQDKIQF